MVWLELFNLAPKFQSIQIGKGPSIWDTYTSQPGIVAEGATGQTACNSYYFYQKDVDALKSLNVRNQDLQSRTLLPLYIVC